MKRQSRFVRNTLPKVRPDLRPIESRALRSVLDTLRPYLSGASVLDLYSGSGRLGFGAVEEGAAQVVMVEKSSKSTDRLHLLCKKNPVVDIHCQDVEKYLALAEATSKKFDIVFADPPYRLWEESSDVKISAFGETLFKRVEKVMAPEGIFLVRYPKRMIASLAFDGFIEWKLTEFGESKLLYLIYGNGKSTNSSIPG